MKIKEMFLEILEKLSNAVWKDGYKNGYKKAKKEDEFEIQTLKATIKDLKNV